MRKILDDVKIVGDLHINEDAIVTGNITGPTIDDLYDNCTEGPFYVLYDPVAGVDPVGNLRLRNQADSDAHGTFKTFAGIANALPLGLKDDVYIRFPAGTYDLKPSDVNNNFMTKVLGLSSDPDKISQIRKARIVFQGHDSWTQVVGTVDMNLSTYVYSNKGTLTLTADPGYTENQYAGYYLLVLSGTAAGQYKPIVSHSGNSFVVAGMFSTAPNNTSVVRIVERPTIINYTVPTTPWDIYCPIGFSRVRVIGPVRMRGTEFSTQNGCVFERIFLYESRADLLDCILKASQAHHVVLASGSTLALGLATRPFLFMGDGVNTLNAIQMRRASYFSGFSYIYITSGQFFVNAKNAAISITWENSIQCYFNASIIMPHVIGSDYFLQIETSGYNNKIIIEGIAYLLSNSYSNLRGNIADIYLAGDTFDWEDLITDNPDGMLQGKEGTLIKAY